MTIFKHLIIFALLTSFTIAAEKPPVFAKGGNIYYQTLQLTHSGKDSDPVLSPDKKCVAFIRETSRESSVPSEHPCHTQQLWKVNVDGKNETMLVRDRKGEPQEEIDRIHQIQFSPDSKQLYFLTSAWGTSAALHCVNIDGTKEHFITDANYLKVIEKGEHKGNLIISKHRYFMYGGSYDFLYIITPKGKEIGPLADDEKNIPWELLYEEREKNK